MKSRIKNKLSKSLFLTFALCSSFYLSASFASDTNYLSDVLSDKDTEYRTVIDSGHTITSVRADAVCMRKFRDYCVFSIGYAADVFEHNYISYIVKNIDNSDFFSLRDSHTPTQDLDIKVFVNRKIDLVTLVMDISQHYIDTSISYTRIMNRTIKDGQLVGFSDLFSDPQLAAVICAQKVYDTFLQYDRQMLPLVKAQIEVNPENFRLLRDGIEFDLTKNDIAPSDVKATVKISLEELVEAKPLKRWFPLAKESLTFDEKPKTEQDPFN